MQMLDPLGKVPDHTPGAISHVLAQCVAPQGLSRTKIITAFCPPMNDHNGILLALCRCAILQPIYFSLPQSIFHALTH